MLDKTDDISVAADNWLVQFEDALASPDDVLLKPLFHPDSYWRDVLALSWNIQTVNRAFAIIEELPSHARRSDPRDFRIDAERAAHSLSAFRGTSRRFEPRGEAAGVRVVDDYAHNPGKLEALVRTADALKESGRLFVVFQPHLYSRTQNAALGLAEALDGADRALVLDVYGAREQPVEGVSGRLITDAMTSGVATFTPTADDALAVLLEEVRSGDLVVTVGAGDITHLGPRILESLERR